MNIILNGGQLLKDLTDAIASWNSGNFNKFGVDLGDFCYRVLLSSEEKFSPDDAYNLIKGLLVGLKFPDVDILMK